LSASEIRENGLFTDENNFCLNLSVKLQYGRVWYAGKKKDVEKSCLVTERAKFAKHVMVFADVCCRMVQLPTEKVTIYLASARMRRKDTSA